MNNKTEYDLYKIIKENYNINRSDIYIKDISNSGDFKNFKELLLKDSYFDWSFCIKYFEKCNYAYHIVCKNINFYILLEKAITKKARDHLFISIYRVYLIKKLFNIKPSQDFNYYILLNPIKRKLPNKNGDRMEAVNINGGFTYFNSNNIYIIRKEDYEKVILHELLHHSDIHFERWSNNNINQIKNICGISDKQFLLPNEAIIETYAVIFNVIFYCIEHNMPFSSLKKMLAEDKEHNIAIAKKILTKHGNTKWYEKTHSYCYIVLRAIFYIYFKEFVQIYRYNNDDDITSFITKYFPRILRKIRENGRGDNRNKYIKQTIFNNF